MNGGTKLGDAQRINYKYIDNNQIIEVEMPLDRYYNLLLKRFNNLMVLLKPNIKDSNNVKRLLLQINSMIIQLNRCEGGD